MGKTISIKVLFGIYLLLMAGKVFAFSCNVDGGSSIGAGTTSVYVNLDPVIQPGQNLVMADRSLVTYFPESNHMLTLDNHDPLSGIPGYKSIPVELEPSN